MATAQAEAPENKRSSSVVLGPDQIDELDRLALKLRTSRSALVRQAVDEYLDRRALGAERPALPAIA